MSNQAEAMMQDQIEGAQSENEALRDEIAWLQMDLETTRAEAILAVKAATAAERERWELHLSAVRALAENNTERGDDCGMLARTITYTLKAMGAPE